MAKRIKIAFLGGIGEIGKNMTVFSYGDDSIIVDAGLSFPNFEESPGIESVIPDYTYVKELTSKVKGIFITHGHEDHIGALPFILKDVKAPVYGSDIALGLLNSKLMETQIKKADLVTIKDNQVIKAGAFSVEFIRVTHSIADSYALSINTPKGTVFLTGDFKIDQTPIDNKRTDLSRIAEIGKKGVLLLMMDSTNVERKGFSMSESYVFSALDKQFEMNKDKRIIVATFASNIHRVQQIINCSIAHSRKVTFAGRSMIKIAEIAKTLGALKYPDDVVVPIEKSDKVPYDRLCVICTGTQGEPMSALTRMANDEFKKVRISELDAVLFSSSAIPGNEKTIYNVINKLSKKGANVVYQALSEIHVSGHAFRGELKLMFSLVNPEYFIPMHGEYRHLKLHKELAQEMGIKPANVFVPEIGACIEVDKSGIKKLQMVKSGVIYVDGNDVLADNSDMLVERKIMAVHGCVIVLAKITLTDGGVTEPILITKGIEITDKFCFEVKNDIASMIASGELEEIGAEASVDKVKKSLQKKFNKRLNKRPLVVVIIEE